MVAALYDLLLLLTTGAAFARGGPEERILAATMAIASILSIIVTDVETTFLAVDPSLLAIDGSVLLVVIVVACLSNCFWPMWAAALQLLVVAASIVPLFSGAWHPLAYALNEQIWAWPLLALIATMSLLRPRADGSPDDDRRSDGREEPDRPRAGRSYFGDKEQLR